MSTSSGVIDFFLHPPLAALRRIEIEGSPFFGRGTLPAPNAGGLLGSAYGVVWYASLVPPHLGQSDGSVLSFERNVLQLDIQHDFGLIFTDRITDQVMTTADQRGLIWFANDYPSQIDYWIFPGFGFRLWWLSL